jgi:hypothetical protein
LLKLAGRRSIQLSYERFPKTLTTPLPLRKHADATLRLTFLHGFNWHPKQYA